MRLFRRSALSSFSVVLALCASATIAKPQAPPASPSPPIMRTGLVPDVAPRVHVALHVDATHAVQGYLRVHETTTVPAGPLTLVYPKWIPGEFAPNGPIPNVADLAISAGGKSLAWTRDPVDLYAFHVDAPAGELAIDFTFLGGETAGYDTGRLATANMLSLEWNKVLMTPFEENDRRVVVTPSIELPTADWKYATALTTAHAAGATIAFEPTTLNELADSPLDAGTNARMIPMGTWDGAPLVLAAFADTPEELAASDATIAKYRALVGQMHALYRYRHFDHYVFLLTLTDEMPGEGLEHHQSSDNGEAGDALVDPKALAADADLLGHEFNHSWDGKFRRAADMATPNLQVPMIDDLLWVYEGMTQYYGALQTERAGLLNAEQWRDSLASSYAYLDHEPGRTHDPLLDTAVASSIRRHIRPWQAERRSQDYYPEGALLWLEADVIITNGTHGKRSLDDVARAFFGDGANTGPVLRTFDRSDIIAAMTAVMPYDWRDFFAQRVDGITAHPPDAFANSGYRLTYRPEPSAYAKFLATRSKTLDAFYSLGFTARADGTLIDVSTESPAGRAGLGPSMKLAAIDDRALADGQQQLDEALTAAGNGTPLKLLVLSGGRYRTFTIAYRGGPRFPRLERVAGPAVLDAIARPLATP